MKWNELDIEAQLQVMRKIYNKIAEINNDEFEYRIHLTEKKGFFKVLIYESLDNHLLVQSLYSKKLSEAIAEVLNSAEDICLTCGYEFPFDKNASLDYFIEYANKV